MKIYIASSWRNPRHPEVVAALRQAGHEVYDYRHPDGPNSGGFAWDQTGVPYPPRTQADYQSASDHRLAKEAFDLDIRNLEDADCVVGLQPFGASTALEMGHAAGRGQLTIQLLSDPPQLELMTKMIDHAVDSIPQLIEIFDLYAREVDRLLGRIPEA